MEFPFDHEANHGQWQRVPRLALHSGNLALAAAAMVIAACAPAPRPEADAASADSPRIVPSSAMSDPIEPVNRGLWLANRALLSGVVRPSARVWREVVPAPARKSISHFGRNVQYPGRVVNHMLQGRWQGAGDESLRFLTNTTVGLGGLFDVASKWDIPKSDADFGETFMHWGWRPSTYLMLPVLGPSDDCNLLGRTADRFANPLNYAEPYTYISAGTTFNRLSESTEDLSRFIRSSADPYADVRMLWSHAVAPGTPDMRLRGEIHVPTLQTLRAAAVRCKDPDFPLQGREMSVRIPATGKSIRFNCWIQKRHAPLVYINPGFGGHRIASNQLSLAEALYGNGFSVVTTTSVFHPEFMEHAATTAMPAYPPADCADLLGMFTAIDQLLEKKYSGRLGARALVGFSMGGFHTLHLAARENERPADAPVFQRYVAINPPVDLHRGINALDSFLDAPLAWPENEREARIDNTFLKAAYLITHPPAPDTIPPFEAAESKLLTGLAFRLVLRDMIFSSQWRHNMGVLKTPLSKWRREPSYQEILGYCFDDCFHSFVIPYYQQRGIDQTSFKQHADLRNFAGKLRNHSKVRVITNRNDFIHDEGDLAWMESIFDPAHLHVHPSGGHLGNIADDAMHAALLKALRGLQ